MNDSTSTSAQPSQPVVITATVPALVGKHTDFDPANPAKTGAHEFTFLSPAWVKDGVPDVCWREYMLVGEAEITITLFPHEDVLKGAVSGLRAQQKKVVADAQAESTRIERQIQSLLAITHETIGSAA